MGRWARGKHSKAISDRSGRKFPYREMVTEWTGARVHKSEFEPKHPQLTPRRNINDPQTLADPRPDSDGRSIYLNIGRIGNPATGEMPRALHLGAHVGHFLVYLFPQTNATGVVATAAAGTVTPCIEFTEGGNAATVAVGSVTIAFDELSFSTDTWGTNTYGN